MFWRCLDLAALGVALAGGSSWVWRSLFRRCLGLAALGLAHAVDGRRRGSLPQGVTWSGRLLSPFELGLSV